METCVKDNRQERFASFDILASVNALRYDLDHFDCILPETRRQVLNQELSFVAEGIDRTARTEFVFKREGEDLVYFDDGRWRPYAEMLEAGKLAAVHDAALDSRRSFLVDWAESDIYQHEQNKRLQPGESRAWVSPYPHEVEQKYGKQFMKDCGLNPERKLGFIYLARCHQDGTITLESQTIDNSDDELFGLVLDAARQDQSLDMDSLTTVYDQGMSAKYGGDFHAGRRDELRQANIWNEIIRNKDLAEYLIDGLSTVAAKNLGQNQLERETKRHIYGVWALFSQRLKGEAMPYTGTANGSLDYIAKHVWLKQEVQRAFKEFASEGRVLTGCGGSVSVMNGESDVMNADSEDVLKAMFTNKAGKNEVMKCVTCPLCKRQGVDANIVYSGKEKTITCSKCKQSKTYKN